MNLEKIKLDNAPEEFNVVIEILQNSDPVKYEIDKESGALVVDRHVATSMFYPCNYGFVPNTLASDGDPLDVLLITNFQLIPNCVINVRPLGVLKMSDESGLDYKIICVPVSKVTSYYDNVKTYKDLPDILLQKIKHFFEHYKDLEKGKWVKVEGFLGIDEAKEIVLASMKKS